MKDCSRGKETIQIEKTLNKKIAGVFKVKGIIKVEKYAEGVDPKTGKPYQTLVCENLFLTTGINEIWELVTGESANHFSNSLATIGVGDDSTSPAAAQTDLLASTNKTYVGMEATYPTTPTSGQVQFKASFGSGSANYAWNEMVVRNSTSVICINRSTNSGAGWGTKTVGSTWDATVTLSIA